MPAYDFECPKGHITEHFMKFAEIEAANNRVICGESGCQEVGEYRPSFWYNSATHFAQRFSPVVIHRDAKGNVRFPANTNAPVPPGFEKVELRDFYQVRKFEKEMELRDQADALKFRTAKQRFTDGQLEENRRVMRGLVERFSPKGKAFYEAMQKISKMRQERGPKKVDPAFYLEAFSMDASNRQAHRDATNDWGQRNRK